MGQHIELAHGGHDKSLALVVDVVRRRGMPTEHLLRFATASDASLLAGSSDTHGQESVSALLLRHGNGGVSFRIVAGGGDGAGSREGRSGSVVERLEAERKRMLEEELALGKSGDVGMPATLAGGGKRKQSAKMLEGWRVNIPGMVSYWRGGAAWLGTALDSPATALRLSPHPSSLHFVVSVCVC